jgi:pyruvate/2-oxoglutarate dehydrogenase complex dihydrolipoamide dehydrogenase (E3) component
VRAPGVHAVQGTAAPLRGARRDAAHAGAREAVNGGLDVPAVLRRRDEIIGVDGDGGAPGDAAIMPRVQAKGITLIRGRGRLTGERRVTIGDEELEARLAVILAGGSLPLLPPIDGLQPDRPASTAADDRPIDPGHRVAD